MDRPLEIRDVENITLEASDGNSDMYPQLVAQFTCQYVADTDCIYLSSRLSVCCSVVRMINVTHAAIMGISVTVRNVSGIVLQQCSHLHIQSSTYSSIQQIGNDFVINKYEVGILAYESSDIEIDSLEASNFTTGVFLHSCNNAIMMDVSVANNANDGIFLYYSTDTSMMNVSAANNVNDGIFLYYSTDTSMMNVSAANNANDGIFLYYSTHTSMMNVSAANNANDGIFLYYSTHTSMMNVSAVHNKYNGIFLYYSTDTSMMNVSVAHNEYDGIYLKYSMDTSMVNVSAANNKYCGISLNYSTDTSMMNVSTAHNEQYGIYMYLTYSNTSMMNVSAENNKYSGIFLYYSTDTLLINVSVAHNEQNGIYLYYSADTSMMNVSAAHNMYTGLRLHYSIDTNLMNVLATHNKYNGIYCNYSTDTNMMNVYAAHNEGNGIYFHYYTDISMMNVFAAHNKYGGIIISYSSDTTMMNASAAHNENGGIIISYSTDTSMMNVSATHNTYGGIMLYYSTDTRMKNVSATHNTYGGIMLYYSTDTRMKNVSALHNQREGLILYKCSNTSLYHTYTNHNKDGLFVVGCINTHIVYHSTRKNIHLKNNKDTYILQSVLSEHSDIKILNTENTYITNTTSFITAYNTTNIVLNETIYPNMDAPSTASSTSEPTSLLAVITLYDTTLTITNCTFTGNRISSIKAISSNVTIFGKVLFYNNTASSGTGLIFGKKSHLITTEQSNIHFQNNHAMKCGGVFYITTEESYETSMSLQDIIQYNGQGSLITSRTECFVHVEGDNLRSHARLTFINNTAGKGGDVLYGGLVALGYDGDWNCLLRFKNISDMSQQSGLSLISSAPSRVCLCNEIRQPDCLTVADHTTHVIYPGQTITIPAVIIGQDFGTAIGSVFAQFLHTPYTTVSVDLEARQYSIAVEHSQCSNLEYTIFSQSEECEAVLVLTHDNREVSHLMNEENNQEITNTWEILSKEPNYKTLAQGIICDFIDFTHGNWPFPTPFLFKYNESNQPGNRTIKNFYKFTPAPIDISNYSHYCQQKFIQTKLVFPKEMYSYPVYINISLRPCPPGFSISKHPPFKCDCNQLMQQLPGVKCHIQSQTISRSGLVWINTDGNETVAAFNCPYNYCNREEIITTLEDPDAQCNFNHSGTLCGGCQPGLSLALGTNQCLHCPNTYIALFLPFTLAGGLLVCFIKVIDLTISQGTLNGLVFYANIVKGNEYLLFTEKLASPLAVFIAWLNLDLGVETCFTSGLTAYGKTWLQFVFPLYIWSIAGLIIILAKYSDKVAKLMGNNSVPVLATLFLLSYAKLFRTIITAFSFTMLSTTHSSKAVWSADGNLDYLGPEHAPLFVVAAVTLLFLWLPYTLLLFLGQWLHRCNCCLITRMLMKIKPFLDAHYGPLKGNHRYWFGALLLVRAVILLISALIPTNRAIITVYSITICVLVLMSGFAVGVYRNLAVATFNAVWFVNLGLLSASHMFTPFEGNKFSITLNCLIGLAFAQFVGLILFKVLVIIKRSKRVMSCLRRGQPAYDDWELYEQAALQREMESESEREESEESGSIDSLPTYGI